MDELDFVVVVAHLNLTNSVATSICELAMSQILTLNAGSSSLKYALFKIKNNHVEFKVASGSIEKIGQLSQIINHESSNMKVKTENPGISDHKAALEHVLAHLTGTDGVTFNSIKTVVHRVVHGGVLTKPHIVTSKILDAIRRAVPLAPLHNPANVLGIETAIEVLPDSVRHVAAFDTSFHCTLPKHAYMYALPMELCEKYGIRKYGFHGLSHEFVTKQASMFLNKPLDSVNLISCHLGAGSSIACIKDGKCIDTTMGMTPLEGLVMATRSGDIDPSVIFYLKRVLNLGSHEVEGLLNEKSGWFGLSGYKDARDLFQGYHKGVEHCITAVEIMVHRIRKYLGAYYWTLNGDVDAIVFTAGLGENESELRKLCLENCKELGFDLDIQLNETVFRKNSSVVISTINSSKKILVIPTNEEKMMVEKALEMIQ